MLIQKELEIVVEGKGLYNIKILLIKLLANIEYQKVSVLYLSNIHPHL